MNRTLRQGGGNGKPSVEIIAHRGANREAPENTIPAFQRAVEIGVTGIELDVQRTLDGTPVVHHDPFLRDGAATSIASLTLSQLRERSDAPTLDEVLQFVRGRCTVYVELKAPEALESVIALLNGSGEWTAVHSFDHRLVLKARALAPDIQTGILLVSYLVDVVGAMRAASARDVWQQADLIDQDLIDRTHDAGGRVIAWTVNDLSRARALAAMGVDGLCTDTPRELLAGLSESKV
jgi:glycerophosphoryl diester phosphodiesterase